MGFCYSKFTVLLHNKDYILDAGCGSGRDSKFFLEQGFNVHAIDASMEMCQLAAEYIGIPVKCLRFDEIEFDSQFNGIWANASLLHIEKSSLPDILRKFNRALKPDGIMYASWKCILSPARPLYCSWHHALRLQPRSHAPSHNPLTS